MSYIESIDRICAQHSMSDNARAVVRALVGAPYYTGRVVREDIDDGVKIGVSQILMDFTMNLNENPFWKEHGAFMMPVFVTALTTYTTSFEFIINGTQPSDQMALMSARNALASVAVAAMFCDKGPAVVHKTGHMLHKQIVDLGDMAVK